MYRVLAMPGRHLRYSIVNLAIHFQVNILDSYIWYIHIYGIHLLTCVREQKETMPQIVESSLQRGAVILQPLSHYAIFNLSPMFCLMNLLSVINLSIFCVRYLNLLRKYMYIYMYIYMLTYTSCFSSLSRMVW
jgi:hypothetical protein